MQNEQKLLSLSARNPLRVPGTGSSLWSGLGRTYFDDNTVGFVVSGPPYAVVFDSGATVTQLAASVHQEVKLDVQI